MKLSLPIAQGATVTLEALAGLVVLQVTQYGLRPLTVAMDTEACAKLIDLLSLMGVTAEEQAFDLDLSVALCELRAKGVDAPRELARPEPGAYDTEIPAFLKRAAFSSNGASMDDSQTLQRARAALASPPPLWLRTTWSYISNRIQS